MGYLIHLQSNPYTQGSGNTEEEEVVGFKCQISRTRVVNCLLCMKGKLHL